MKYQRLMFKGKEVRVQYRNGKPKVVEYDGLRIRIDVLRELVELYRVIEDESDD